MKKIIAIILIVLGIGIAASPFIGEMITNRRNYLMMKQLADYEKAFQDASTSLTPPVTTDPSITPGPNDPSPTPFNGYDYNYMSFENQSVIGIISIDKLFVKIPIIQGIENENLKLAIGHYPESAVPGSAGNVVLAGHRSYSFGQFFNRLNEMEAGDKIDLTYRGIVYEYVVYDTFEVLPEDTWVLEPPEDKQDKIATLITCTPVYNPTHRLIVRARLQTALQ
jgi:sortase A